MIQENLNDVRERIAAACERVGRSPEEVRLIAVSKTKPFSMILEAVECGQIEFGENKVQEILEKETQRARLHWHMIGHLQRNKVKQVIDKVELIHSVDSIRLAEQIEQEAAKQGIEVSILLEINVAEEESKFGFLLSELEEAILSICKLPHVKIQGLMTIAPNVEDPEENRMVFRKLYQVFVDIRSKNIDNVSMSVLSMGMTGDFEVAIEEGSTMIRVGTGIFGIR